ncbi:MAG: hypothetical protein HFE64_03245 [Lachnospiraceae bacterium]|jgi:hypothetical protein|nr:hypothetical protein [Lachnospiraceae bacterium]
MNELVNTKNLVAGILKQDKTARDSDDYLYYLVCKEKMKAAGDNIDGISFRDGLIYRSFYGLPAFETVRRARQKIQAQNPDLCASADMQGMREMKEARFRAFAKEE